MNSTDEEDWEICNDDGFVYKRRRLNNLLSDYPPPQSPTSSARRLQAATRRSRKKKTLLSLKRKYELELQQWQKLSDSLSHLTTTTASANTVDSVAPNSNETEVGASKHQELDELILQVETQEAIFKKLEELCDNIDAICEVEEEKVVNELLDLDVWGSPRQLVRSLTTPFQD